MTKEFPRIHPSRKEHFLQPQVQLRVARLPVRLVFPGDEVVVRRRVVGKRACEGEKGQSGKGKKKTKTWRTRAQVKEVLVEVAVSDRLCVP
jgi:hypothetical protein